MQPSWQLALVFGLAVSPAGCLSAKEACTRHGDCPAGAACVNGRCVDDGDTATTSDTDADDTGPVDTVSAVDTTSAFDTAPPPCTLAGALRPCQGNCPDLAFPVQRCVDGAWSACG